MMRVEPTKTQDGLFPEIMEERFALIFRESEIDQLEEGYEGATRDHAIRVKSLVKRLRENAAEKLLVSIPESWRHHCDQLEYDFPNFHEVVRFIRHQLALSAISNSVFKLPPFLLIGDAGVGKTEFVLTLAGILKTKFELIDVSNSQTGSALSGSENFWGNTKPGMLFNTLVFSDVANPIILLDEIDKVSVVSAHKPLAALHSLLEPRQASQFQDLSVPELKIDASHVVWIATANTLEPIEKPIIDRFNVFVIDAPAPDQMQVIVKNQYQRFIEKNPAGSYFEKCAGEDVIDTLCLYHPRNVRKMLELSFGMAAYEQRNYLTVNDILSSKIKEKIETTSKGIGFMSLDI